MCLKGLGSHYPVEQQQRDPARSRRVQDRVDQECAESPAVETLVRQTDPGRDLDEQYGLDSARARSPV
jgi:hypothetical protein